MPYEIVDPAERDTRGVIHPSLTDAMIGAGPHLEVWELADDEAQTRTVRCWPDPEFEPAGPPPVAGSVTPAKAEAARRWKLEPLDKEYTERFVNEHIGRAEREATAILAEHNPVAPDKVHAVVSLAWGRGFIAGFGAGHEAFAHMLERLTGGGQG